MSQQISRRNFLKHSGALGAISSVGVPMVMNLMPTTAMAADNVGGYRALVCVFLAGGNDAFNTVVRTDAGVARYLQMRPNIALPQTTITNTNYKLDLTNRNFTGTAGLGLMLNPKLSRLTTLFNQGKVALVGNVGPLVKPMKASVYTPGATDVPPKLFSHNDQQSVWQSGKAEGATSGWGGELVRRLAAANKVNGAASNLFSSIAVEANTVFSAGSAFKGSTEAAALKAVSTLGLSSKGALKPGGGDWTPGPGVVDTNGFWYGQLKRDDVLLPIFSGAKGVSTLTVGTATTKHLIETDYVSKLTSANNAWLQMTAAQAASSKANPAPAENVLAKQLEAVANVIKARNGSPLSYARQVFFVQLGGFDTHSGQTANGAHDKLLATLDEALGYFYNELGTDVANVTTFTASEFGRKLNANGDGSDHGWGGHHFVLGGGVKAGVYGQFPDFASWDGSKYPDAQQLLSDGTMIPAVAVDTFAKELGGWLGVKWTDGGVNTELSTQLFPSASTTLLGMLTQA
jgi:uncharacterized protein (DUF1501 family)